jgi:hypothetical protein
VRRPAVVNVDVANPAPPLPPKLPGVTIAGTTPSVALSKAIRCGVYSCTSRCDAAHGRSAPRSSAVQVVEEFEKPGFHYLIGSKG